MLIRFLLWSDYKITNYQVVKPDVPIWRDPHTLEEEMVATLNRQLVGNPSHPLIDKSKFRFLKVFDLKALIFLVQAICSGLGTLLMGRFGFMSL
jgi:hypothetical protein